MSVEADMRSPSLDSYDRRPSHGLPAHSSFNGVSSQTLMKQTPRPYLNTTVSMTLTSASAPVTSNTLSPHPPLGAFNIMMPTSTTPTNHSASSGSSVDQPSFWQSNTTPPLYLPQASPIELPSPNPPFTTAMGEAVGRSKGSGLIRRLSRGAHNRLRRRASTTQTNRIRDQSAGPVLVRRRSDSTHASDFAGDMSDLELEPPSEDGAEDNSSSIASIDPMNALGISAGRKETSSTPSFEGGIAPTISSVLEQGTWLIKVTKKKRKTLKFRLDTSAAKVCWNNSDPTKQFYIDDVREIRVGADARNSREDIQIPADIEGCWITIVYDVPEGNKGRSIKTMHLIAPNEYIVKLWTDALKVVERERIEIMNALSSNSEKSERSMQMAWKAALARRSSSIDLKIDFEDARWICRKLEINCSLDAIRMHFNEADRDMVGMLNYSQYMSFVNLFKVRKDIQAVYNALKPADEFEISMDTFFRFLRETQSIDVDKDRPYWEARYEYFCRTQSPKSMDALAAAAPASMGLSAFRNFLTSSSNPCLTSASTEPTLDRPLNEYFISSSHNTYLLGRQVAGASSVEGYIATLVKGCRCIEIDCWDGKHGRPVVNHGRTLSSEVLFEDCISVINKYAFTSSPYPLIISLEVHCTPDQQAVMVEIMKRYFGDSLLLAPLAFSTTVLPSPEELRNRVLIKVKSTHPFSEEPTLQEVANGQRSRSASTQYSRPILDTSNLPTSPPSLFSTPDSPQPRTPGWSTPRGSSTTSTTNGASAATSGSESEALTPSLDSKKKLSKTSNITPTLSALGVYTCGIKYSDFNAPEARAYNHIYSFAENTFNNICKEVDSKEQLERHNARYLMRMYPAARRIDSSNFNPLQSWKRGVQMAALNWQTYDVNLQINDAMFAAGIDKTGYVLKPEELRQIRHLPSPETIPEGQPVRARKGMKFVKFSVEIISAQRLPRPRTHNPDQGMNPYIEFEMYSAEERARGIARGEGGTDASARDGYSGIGTPLRKRTKIAEGNGFDPVFNQLISMTVETEYPGLLFVRWTVWNSPDGRNLSSNSTMLATFTAKLSSLQQGYRQLPLFNAYGERFRDAKLFVKIKKEAPIPLNVDEQAYSTKDSTQPSPRIEPARNERSWSRKIFSRTPSQRKKSREPSPYESFSRTSSMERA